MKIEAQDQLNLVMIQSNPTVGALSENAKQILAARRAHSAADLLIFSECFLTGYPLQDQVCLPHFIDNVERTIDRLAEYVRSEPGPAILFGAPAAGADKPYNAAILIRADGTRAITYKQELPNNDVFDEMRNFARGEGKALPISLNARWKLGVLICEDGWHSKVAHDLAGEGADFLISLNGSPCRLNKQALREQHMKKRVADTNLPLIYLNLVGGQDELVFDGASFIVSEKGEISARLKFMEPDEATITAKRDEGKVTLACNAGIAPVPSNEELMYRAGVLGLRDYARKNNVKFGHVGISGGADSALVAAMAADALGADWLRGIRLPSKLTGNESMDLADQLMGNIGSKLETVAIADAAEAVLTATRHLPAANEAMQGLGQENLQARLRMIMLMYANNVQGGMLLGTSNKSESSLGYTTIYGDMAGHYNPIKDLFKTDVWAVMRWRNANIPADSACKVDNPIPEAIITRPPTAELKEGQTDEASLGSYETLDPFLKLMIEEHLDSEAARREMQKLCNVELEPAYATRIRNMIYWAEFKRRQACIGPQIRPNSFGLARRYPITNNYNEERFTQ